MFLFTSMFLSSFSHRPFSGMPKGTQKPHSRRKGETLRRCAFLCMCVFAGMPAFQIYYIMPPAKGFCKPILSENAGKPALKNRFAAQKSV